MFCSCITTNIKSLIFGIESFCFETFYLNLQKKKNLLFNIIKGTSINSIFRKINKQVLILYYHSINYFKLSNMRTKVNLIIITFFLNFFYNNNNNLVDHTFRVSYIILSKNFCHIGTCMNLV